MAQLAEDLGPGVSDQQLEWSATELELEPEPEMETETEAETEPEMEPVPEPEPESRQPNPDPPLQLGPEWMPGKPGPVPERKHQTIVCVARAAATAVPIITESHLAAGVSAVHVYVPGDVVQAFEQRTTPAGKLRVRTEHGWISLVATDGTTLFVEHVHKALARHRATRMGQLGALAFDKHWVDLTSDEKGAADSLGWNPESWEQGGAPMVCLLGWNALEPEQQQAAGLLGFEGDSWSTQRAEQLANRERGAVQIAGAGLPVHFEAELFGWQQQLDSIRWLRCISPAGVTKKIGSSRGLDKADRLREAEAAGGPVVAASIVVDPVEKLAAEWVRVVEPGEVVEVTPVCSAAGHRQPSPQHMGGVRLWHRVAQ